MKMITAKRATILMSALSITLLSTLFLRVQNVSALEITLDSGGAGTAVLMDLDLDGTVDFNTTVGGVFLARGTAKETFGTINNQLAIGPLSPFPEVLFRNVDTISRTFTVTVSSTAFTAALAPPLGWNIFYHGIADDTLGVIDPTSVVSLPTHSVQCVVNAGALVLGQVTGTAISTTSPIDHEESGVDNANQAADVRMVWTFTLGPEDEIRLLSDNGFDGDSIQVDVYNHSLKCIDKMNNDARKVVDKAQKSDAKCVKKGKGTDVTACVDDAVEEKTDKQEQKLIAHFAEVCDPVPAWGVNRRRCCEGGIDDGQPCNDIIPCSGGQCEYGACISARAESSANDLTHDLFGTAVVVSTDKAVFGCQKKVAALAGKLLVEHWKVFRKCKKDSFSTILDDGDLVSVCLGPPQPDPKDKIAKRKTNLTDQVQKTCLDKGVTALGTVFPGACTSVADLAFAQCVAERTACRFCRAANRADAIVPPLNCDSFNDGVSNASCSP